MRLFVAADISAAVRRGIANIAAELGRQCRVVGAGDNIRWIAETNLHVTLKFLGEVDEARTQAIRETLADPLVVAPFEVSFRGVGAFPPNGPLRIVWIGAAQGGDSLRQVYDAVERRLGPFGFAPEDRPFRAHVTIGRFRRPERRHAAAVRRILQETAAGADACRIDHVTLYESRLGPGGSEYVALHRCALTS